MGLGMSARGDFIAALVMVVLMSGSIQAERLGVGPNPMRSQKRTGRVGFPFPFVG